MVLTSNGDALACKAVARLNKLVEKSGTENTNFDVLIPDSASQHFILGPALKSVNNVPGEFPKRKGEDFLVNNQNIKFYEWFRRNHRFWPTYDHDWVSWFKRVEDQKGYIWHRAGIYDVLQFSKLTIPFNRALVLAALCFWSTSTNSFHLGHGPLSITLLDLSALVGLRPDGFQFDALVANSMSLPGGSFIIDKLSNFSSFIREHNNIEGVVTDEEHVAFLLCWLSRYLICNRSFKIVKSNLPLALALSRGESYALGPLVLAYLYRGINDLLQSRLRVAGGPLWILQLWIHAYFPKLHHGCLPVPINPSCEGLKYVFYEEPEFSLQDCLRYMCQTDSEENFNFIPYSESDALPSWLIFPRSGMSATELATLVDIWASFLVSRDLPFGLSLGKGGNKTCGVEAYCPNLCARQFGLIQDIPTPPFFSFNTHFPERTIFHSSEEFQAVEVTRRHLFMKFELVPFSLVPSATSFFKVWWGKYYKEAFPHDQDLNYMFELDDLNQNRPIPPPKRSYDLRKRKESTLVQTEGCKSDQRRAKRPTKRFKCVDQQAKNSSGHTGKEDNTLRKSKCLKGQGRAHSRKRKIKTAYHLMRRMIKGNFCFSKSELAILEKRSSSVSQDKRTKRPPKKRSHSGRGQGCSKRRKTKEEVHHHLTNLPKSNFQSDSQANGAASAKNTGPRSGQQQSDALDDVDSELKDLPTQPVDAKLPSGISSPVTQEAEVASNESPVQERSSHPNPSSKENGSYHSCFQEQCDLKMSKPKTSIRALDFPKSYLLQRPDACFSGKTEEAARPDSDKISEAKAYIQSSLALSVDEVMEIDCFQKFKSSLELFLKANGADLGYVQGKLEFVESRYHSAIAVTAEVNNEFKRKIELEGMVQRYSSRVSRAQQKEQRDLACIKVQESTLEEDWKRIFELEAVVKGLKERVAEEEAVLKRLKEWHSESEAKVNAYKFKYEQSHEMLHEECINEETRVMKAFEAKKDLELVGETWSQIQQCISLIL